jgi:hypothetical protein
MAVASDLLTRVRAVAALLDDAALAALANKGLVRRARKDLEQSRPEIVGDHEDRLRVKVEEWIVELAERPAESRCGCPASGVCRHIVAALLHVGAPASGARVDEAPSSSCGAEVLAATDDELRRWAGSALVKRALVELASGLIVEGEDGAPLVLREPSWNVECRWMPGGGLAGMLCSCHASGACVHKVVAVLGWQARQGQRDIAAEEAVLAESAGAPRTREEVRESVQQMLHEMIGLGLCRLSSASQARIKTLATSAHGVDLPRLERLLSSLADEVGAWLRRDAQASSAAILMKAGQVEALTTALVHPKPALVGRHRSRYDRLGELELVGLGARVWRTRSGFTGLTVYFWDRGQRRWTTWTDARPVGTPAFDPEARFTAPGPWTGCDSPARAAASRLRLVGAWRSPAGRLSGRESTRMVELGPSDPGSVQQPITSWPMLVPQVWQLFGTGLAERGEVEQVLLLQPHAWGKAVYDEVLQELRVAVADDEGRLLLLALAHTEENRRAIDTLEAATRAQPPRILGLLHLRRGALVVEPISLATEDRVISLGLDGSGMLPARAVDARTDAWIEENEAAEVDAEDEDVTALDQGPIGQLLAATTAELEGLAEGGVAAYRGWSRLRGLTEKSERLGLAALSSSLRRLVSTAGQTGSSQAAAEACLRVTYVVELTAATAAVAAATEVYGR